MGNLKSNKFQCDECGGVFTKPKSWSHEKAMAEYDELSPDEHGGNLAQLCDDCWHALPIIQEKLKRH